MRRRSLISAVLAAALLLGQALAGAHDSGHGLQPGAAHACAVCVYAHGAGHGVVPGVPTLVFEPPVAAPHAATVLAQAAVTVRLHPIRGPPALPV
jgi:hypothetical protein